MTKIKRRLIVSQEIVMCSRELWQTMCQMEQFKEQGDITEVLTIVPRNYKFMDSPDIKESMH